MRKSPGATKSSSRSPNMDNPHGEDMIPETWKRKEPPVYRFPTAIRWLAGFCGLYTMGMTLLLASYANEWTTVLLLIPMALAGQIAAMLAWSEQK